AGGPAGAAVGGAHALLRADDRGAGDGNQAHHLHASGHDQVLDSRHHGLGREVDGLLGGAALAVDGGARNVFGQARGQPGGAGDVGRLRAELVDAAEDDVVDLAGVDAGALDRGLDDVPGEVGRVDLAQTALPAPHGGADSADDV